MGAINSVYEGCFGQESQPEHAKNEAKSFLTHDHSREQSTILYDEYPRSPSTAESVKKAKKKVTMKDFNTIKVTFSLKTGLIFLVIGKRFIW